MERTFCKILCFINPILIVNRDLWEWNYYIQHSCCTNYGYLLKIPTNWKRESTIVHSFLKMVLARSSLYESKVLFTKHFQASTCWHQLKYLVKVKNEWVLNTTFQWCLLWLLNLWQQKRSIKCNTTKNKTKYMNLESWLKFPKLMFSSVNDISCIFTFGRSRRPKPKQKPNVAIFIDCYRSVVFAVLILFLLIHFWWSPRNFKKFKPSSN
jgi:hypothetical protein